MSLKNQITEDMKAAMRARRLRAFRRFACCWQPSSSVKSTSGSNSMTAPCWPLSRADQNSAAIRSPAVRRAGREDLASAERFEIDVLSAYMPAAWP